MNDTILAENSDNSFTCSEPGKKKIKKNQKTSALAMAKAAVYFTT